MCPISRRIYGQIPPPPIFPPFKSSLIEQDYLTSLSLQFSRNETKPFSLRITNEGGESGATDCEIEVRPIRNVYTHVFHPGLYPRHREDTLYREEEEGATERNPSPDTTCLIFFTPFHEYLGGFSRSGTSAYPRVG